MTDEFPTREDFLARWFRPSRPRLAEALACANGHDDPRACWEALAARSVIPADWVDTPTRRFEALVDFGRWQGGDPDALPRGWVGPPNLRMYGLRQELFAFAAHPPTLPAVVTFAADPAGVAAAEVIAVELSARLAPWGVTPTRQFSWAFVEPSTWRKREWAFSLICDALRSAERAANQVESDPDARTARSPEEAEWEWLSRGHRRWQRAVREGWRVPSLRSSAKHNVPPQLYGVPFAALPEPFVPYLALRLTGYEVAEFSSDVAALAAPQMDLAR